MVLKLSYIFAITTINIPYKFEKDKLSFIEDIAYSLKHLKKAAILKRLV